MCLLYLASHSGSQISKLLFVESEYLRAAIVKGHIFLKTSNTNPSIITAAMQIQTHTLILLFSTA